MDKKKEPPDNNGKVNFSKSKPRSKSKTGDHRHNAFSRPPILDPLSRSCLEPQPSLLRRRLTEARHSYVPSYTGCYRSPCESSSHYGTSVYSPRRPVYAFPPSYTTGYRDTFYPPRPLPCAHSSPVRRVGLSSPVPSHGFPLPSCYEPTLCRQSYYESYLRTRMRDFQASLCRSVAPRVTHESDIKRQISAAQQTSDRSESEAESSLHTDENESRQSVNFTKFYDPCAGRDRLLDTILQMDALNDEDLCSVDENATEDGTADQANEMRAQRGERRVRDICEKYRRGSSENDEKKVNEDDTEEGDTLKGPTDTGGDTENAEKDKEEVIEAIDENVHDDKIDKDTIDTKEHELQEEKQTEANEQEVETKTDLNVEETGANEPRVETTEDNTHEELVQDITAAIEEQLDSLLQNLDTKMSDRTSNVLSKYIVNTGGGSVVYHMSCSSVEHMVKFIKEIHPQFNGNKCQSLPSIDMSQAIEVPVSSNIRTTLAFASRSWGTLFKDAPPKLTTSFSSDAISLYLQHLDISQPQLMAEALDPIPVNSSILGDIESEVLRNSLEESTEMFSQDLNEYSSSEELPCTKTVTFILDR